MLQIQVDGELLTVVTAGVRCDTESGRFHVSRCRASGQINDGTKEYTIGTPLQH